MSKGNMFLGHARGKVGSVVFYRANGQQITRTRAEVVKNPRSVGQNTQRAIFATIAKAAAAMSGIVDHSFAGIAYGTESMRQFRKLNIDKLRREYLDGVDVALTPKGGSFMPNAYQISSGNLPSFQVINDADGTNVHFRMGVTVTDDEPVIDWGMMKVRYPNILPGDQLTVVKIVTTGGTLRDGDGQFALQYDRIILSPNESLLRDLDYIVNVDGFNPAAVDQTVTTNLSALVSTDGGGTYYLGLGAGNQVEQGIYACALILSRRIDDQTWQRSTQSLAVINFDDVQDTAAAIATYDGTSGSLAGSEEYLDQAIATEAAPGLSGPYMQVEYEDEYTVIRSGGSSDLPDILYNNNSVISVVAYGTAENPIVSLQLAGDIADGNYQQIGIKNGNTANLEFSIPNDGNFVGTYQIWATFRDAQRALLNFNVIAEEPEP